MKIKFEIEKDPLNPTWEGKDIILVPETEEDKEWMRCWMDDDCYIEKYQDSKGNFHLLM
jgi:hypothetical protein